MRSWLLGNSEECYVCGTTRDLHKHHIFYGSANRKLSERDGCVVYLCRHHHNGSDAGVHFNKGLDLSLKRACQRAWQDKYGKTTDDFIKVFGRSYL